MRGAVIAKDIKNKLLSISEIITVEIWRDTEFEPFFPEELPAANIKDVSLQRSGKQAGEETYSIEIELFVEREDTNSWFFLDELIEKIYKKVDSSNCSLQEDRFEGYEKEIKSYSDAVLLKAKMDFIAKRFWSKK